MRLLLVLCLASLGWAQEKPSKISGDFLYTVDKESRQVTITGYQGNADSLVVPPKIEGMVVGKIGEKAFSHLTSVTEVSLPEGLREIGKHAFFGCYYLARIKLPQSLTTLGDASFSQCRALSKIDFPSQLTNIPSESFSGCSSLEQITIPAKVTQIGDRAFSECTTLKAVLVSVGTESIGDYAFAGCLELTEVTLLSRKTSLGRYVFSGCAVLDSIRWPSDKPLSVKNQEGNVPPNLPTSPVGVSMRPSPLSSAKDASDQKEGGQNHPEKLPPVDSEVTPPRESDPLPPP